ncbi:unnamed protein product [Urochloa humidicola]
MGPVLSAINPHRRYAPRAGADGRWLPHDLPSSARRNARPILTPSSSGPASLLAPLASLPNSAVRPPGGKDRRVLDATDGVSSIPSLYPVLWSLPPARLTLPARPWGRGAGSPPDPGFPPD